MDQSRTEADKQEQLQQGMAQIRQRYVRQLPTIMEDLHNTWHGLARIGWTREDGHDLCQRLHSLAGTGATLGLIALSSHASTFEQLLLSILKSDEAPSQEQLARMGEQYGRLHEAFLATLRDEQQRPPQEQPMNSQALLSPAAVPPLATKTDGVAPLTVVASLFQPADPDNRRVYLYAEDLAQVQELVPQLGYFGYLARTFDELDDLLRAVATNVPVAIVRDIRTLRHRADNGVLQPHNVATLFLAEQGDFALRLEAVRSGGQAYFTYPVDVGALVDWLDELTVRRQPEPYRILIVDDEPHAVETYASVLQTAGMQTEQLTNPLQVMRPLVEFNPDVILMDVYMPGCTGLEVAAVIRQQEAFVGVPIVFLSAETRLDRQLTAMHQGGDDFLHKSISPAHLVSAVSSRAQRSRALRNTMSRDGLTGLLNHTATKEQLDREIRLARRRAGQLVFALIDLDHFKQVNDTYGHSTGDRVLKSLARLLHQRLRRTDLVGRYGGEEFAIIMIDTSGERATYVLNDVREKFAQLNQRSGQHEFAVTFSCGVASFPLYSNPADLSRAADHALYRAKRNGRNQIVQATDPLSDLNL